MRKILSVSLSIILSFIISCSSVRALQLDTQNITTESNYDEFGNYYNSETGEYFNGITQEVLQRVLNLRFIVLLILKVLNSIQQV